MPIFEYYCKQCNKMIEMIVKVFDKEQQCEECNHLMEKQLSAPGLVFKGNGWTTKQNHEDLLK